jgi:uncharacterized protein (DUF1330 family)
MQMSKGYWVTTYRSIKDPDKLAAYAKLAPVALAPFGVKYIVRGAAVAASEAAPPATIASFAGDERASGPAS